MVLQGQEMERLCSLFFELSNEDRLNILLKLMDEPMKLTHLAKELDLTVQECSRQLSRLTNIDLVTKDPDGFFVLQPYGRHAFRLFPSYQFLAEHVEYFNRHTLGLLPEKFMGRIGELLPSGRITRLMEAFSNVDKVLGESEEFFWIMTNENLITVRQFEMGYEALERGVQIKVIEPMGYQPPSDIVEGVSDKIKEEYDRHRVNGHLDDRVYEKIDTVLYLNEKEVGVLAFPSETGEFDYLGFTSKDPKVIEWCRDLFTYYWDNGAMREEFYITTE